jgi:hypothetical protein
MHPNLGVHRKPQHLSIQVDCIFMVFTYDSRPMVDRDAPKLTGSAGMDDEQSIAYTSNGEAAFYKQSKAQTVT